MAGLQSEHVEVRVEDLASQGIYVGSLDRSPIGFETAEQFVDSLVASGNRDGHLLPALHVATAHGGEDVLGTAFPSVSWSSAHIA